MTNNKEEDLLKIFNDCVDDYKNLADEHERLLDKYENALLYNFFISSCFAVYVIASTIK